MIIYNPELLLILGAYFRYCALNVVMGVINALPTKTLNRLTSFWSMFINIISLGV